MKKILILCTGNSCRSQIAHGYLNHLTDNSVSVFSAGIEKHGLNSNAVRCMPVSYTHLTLPTKA